MCYNPHNSFAAIQHGSPINNPDAETVIKMQVFILNIGMELRRNGV
jgi:hypothetical protein